MKVISTMKKKFIFAPKQEEDKNIFETIELDQIKTGTPFVDLFPINPDTLKSITEDMKVNGFDSTQPIIIWKETNMLIDGHTRSTAAKQAGLLKVACVYESFPDVDAALKYAYGLQFKRRNLSDADRFQFSETYLNNVGQGNKKGNWKKKELSEILSVSVGTAQKYISVISRGSEKSKKAVRSGIITINSAYNSLLYKEKRGSGSTENKVEKSAKNEVNFKVIPGKNTGNFIQIDEEVLMRKLEEWASETDIEMGNFFPFKERLLAIYEVLPDGSKLKQFTQELLDRGVSNERARDSK